MTDHGAPDGPQVPDRYRFRRQFVIGPRPFTPGPCWSSAPLLHGLFLSVHCDLASASASGAESTAYLLGVALDPFDRSRGEAGIIEELVGRAPGIEACARATTPLAGRWVVVFQDDQGTFIFTDPCGFREVYYHTTGGDTWCGSQPGIIAAARGMTLSDDEELLAFAADPSFARHESAWVGSATPYAGCHHLLPNHYLAFDPLRVVRFYPSDVTSGVPASEVVVSASRILQGTMAALTTRFDICVALSAGWDSRVLLAASRSVREDIDFFVYRDGLVPPRAADAWVPPAVASSLGVELDVRACDTEVPDWFMRALSENVVGSRLLPKTRVIFDKYRSGDERLYVSGNAGEICRNRYDRYDRLDGGSGLDGAGLARLMGYADIPYVVGELARWRAELDVAPDAGLSVLDLLHWEQRLGNWGAQYPSEQDIAVDEVGPFNCRLLIETLASAPRVLRKAPRYLLYRELVQHMWPEALSVPVNPVAKGDVIGAVGRRVRPYLPEGTAALLRRLLRRRGSR